jgi:GntR family transcriptional regulator, rspAB operon transcriptional repressor
MVIDRNKNTMPIMPARSIADQIYERAKYDILNGVIKPGHRLQELDVVKAAQVSRTPVREAFRRLEQDCLVERVARGGVRVIQLEWETIKDLYELRTVLEVHAIKLACQRITPEQIVTLKQTKAQAMELLNSPALSKDYILNRFMDLNAQFHETIYQATGSRFMMPIINQLRGIVQVMRSVSLQADHAYTHAWEEHSHLIHQLEKRDVKMARTLIRQHVQRAAQEVLSIMMKKARKT